VPPAQQENNPLPFRDDATADEPRAELMKRLEILTSAGLIDLQALPAPSDGIVKRPKRSVDHAAGSNFNTILSAKIGATPANASVSNSAGVNQCQSRRMKYSRRFQEN
jgi:hypothetical protein